MNLRELIKRKKEKQAEIKAKERASQIKILQGLKSLAKQQAKIEREQRYKKFKELGGRRKKLIRKAIIQKVNACAENLGYKKKR